MLVKLFIAIIFLILLSFFIAENAQETIKLNFFNYTLGEKIPIVVLIMASMLIGIIITLPIYFKQKLNHFKQYRKQKKEIKNLKKTPPPPPKISSND